MGAAERADQVGVEDALPEILAQPVELGKRDWLGGRRGSGIVDEEIEAPQRVDRPGRHGLGLARLRDVAERGDNPMPLPLQPRDLLRTARILGQVIERDSRAATREGLDRGEPDTRGAAGDERSLAGEISGDHEAGSVAEKNRLGDCVVAALPDNEKPRRRGGRRYKYPHSRRKPGPIYPALVRSPV